MDFFAHFEVVQDLGIWEWDPDAVESDTENKASHIQNAAASGSGHHHDLNLERVTAGDIEKCLTFKQEVKAPDVKPLSLLTAELDARLQSNWRGQIQEVSNLRFARGLPPDNQPTGFPTHPPRIVPLYVAEKRGLDLSTIDFLIGGSFLKHCGEADCFGNATDIAEYFASVLDGEVFNSNSVWEGKFGQIRTPGEHAPFSPQKRREVPFLVENCKGVTVISKAFEHYVENRAATTFQFRRWAWGEPQEGRHTNKTWEHLRVMQIGKYRVLISASVDSVLDAKPVKVNMRQLTEVDPNKVDNRQIDVKTNLLQTMLQMISSGCDGVVNGERNRFGWLTAVNFLTLQELAERTIGYGMHTELLEHDGKVVAALDALARVKHQLEDKTTYAVYREDGAELCDEESNTLRLGILGAESSVRLLPRPEVVEGLWLDDASGTARAKLDQIRRVLPDGKVPDFASMKKMEKMAEECDSTRKGGAEQEEKERADLAKGLGRKGGKLNGSHKNSAEENVGDEDGDSGSDFSRDEPSSCDREPSFSDDEADFHDCQSFYTARTQNTMATARSAVTHTTASSLGINEHSRWKQEQIRDLIDVLGRVQKLVARRSDVHYWLAKRYDARYRGWMLRLPEPLQTLGDGKAEGKPEERDASTIASTSDSESGKTKADDADSDSSSTESTPPATQAGLKTASKYWDDFPDFLRYLRNQEEHLGDYAQYETPAATAALNWLAEKAGRPVDDLRHRSRGFSSALFREVLRIFPELPSDIEKLRKEGTQWTSRGAAAIERLQLENNNGGQGVFHQAVDRLDSGMVKKLLGVEISGESGEVESETLDYTLGEEYILWENAAGETAVDFVWKKIGELRRGQSIHCHTDLAKERLEKLLEIQGLFANKCGAKKVRVVRLKSEEETGSEEK